MHVSWHRYAAVPAPQMVRRRMMPALATNMSWGGPGESLLLVEGDSPLRGLSAATVCFTCSPIRRTCTGLRTPRCCGVAIWSTHDLQSSRHPNPPDFGVALLVC
eukprot:gene13052-biopygen3479